MKLAIFGAGKAGRYLKNQIIENEDANIEILGFLDNILTGEVEGMKIYTPNQFFNIYNDIDAVIIAAGNQKAIKIMMNILLDKNIRNIYLMQDIVGKNQLPIFETNNFIPNRVRKIRFSKEKPTLHYFELPITDKCNLNCKGCLFACGPKGNPEDVPYEQIIKDIARMRELFEDIPWIRVLGGEPLMHPNIEDILKYIRKEFSDSEVDLCTNGLLLPHMQDHFFECLAQHQISIHISGYPPTYKMLSKIKAILEMYHLDNVTLEREKFYKFYTLSPTNDMTKSYKRCMTSGCHEVYKGKILPCSAAIAFHKFNEQFGTEYQIVEGKDYFNLYETDLDSWDLVKKLNVPIPICKYCSDSKTEAFDWESVKASSKLNDYIL